MDSGWTAWDDPVDLIFVTGTVTSPLTLIKLIWPGHLNMEEIFIFE